MKYTSEDIKVIRGLEPIRKRPQMFFKQEGRDICIALLKDTLQTLIEEKYGCSATEIQIKALGNGSVRINYNGSGMPINEIEENGIKHPSIYLAIMRAFNKTETTENFKTYGHLYAIGGFLAAMAKNLTVVTSAPKCRYEVSFEFGCVSSLLSKFKSSGSNQILVEFWDDLLKGRAIDEEEVNSVIKWCREEYQHATITYS